MNYELAKELKDAGFPQHDTLPFDAYEPSLEELIEACDITLETLEQDKNEDPNHVHWWTANSVHGVQRSAPTPTEAIAKLWLALHAV
jgi:hypothetical protein